MKNRAFWNSLHGRNLTAADIAAVLHSTRSHVTQVLNGTRSGTPTKNKILRLGILTPAEIETLGWAVPHGTKSQVEPSKPPLADRRKVFNVGDFSVSLRPDGEAFAFEIFDPADGEVAEETGFECLGLAESAARRTAVQLILDRQQQ